MRSHPKYIDSGYDEERLCKIIADNAYNPVWIKSLKAYYGNQNL